MVNPSASSTNMKKSVTATTTPAPVAAASTPASAPKKLVKKVAAEKVEVAPVPVAPTPVPVEEAAPPAEEVSWQAELKAAQDQLTSIREVAATALAALKRLERRATREIKDAAKNRRKARREAAEGEERKPSVFKTPIPISDDLAAFLGQAKGSLMSRSGVTKAISAYVKEKGLNDKHAIKADSALQKLLGVSASDELTIFNLQRYLNRHYVKPVAAAATKA